MPTYVKEAAERLGVSPLTVDPLARGGELKCVEFYGHRQYSGEFV